MTPYWYETPPIPYIQGQPLSIENTRPVTELSVGRLDEAELRCGKKSSRRGPWGQISSFEDELAPPFWGLRERGAEGFLIFTPSDTFPTLYIIPFPISGRIDITALEAVGIRKAPGAKAQRGCRPQETLAVNELESFEKMSQLSLSSRLW